MPARIKNEHGFTLVEVLVVIIIIGILAAIAIPAFLNQRQRANDAALQSDMKSVALAVEDYIASGSSWDELVTKTGSAYFVWSNTPSDLATATVWNNQQGLTPQKVSRGSSIWLRISHPSMPNSFWDRKHQDSEYCLFGHTQNGKKYTTVAGGGKANYARQLYYDSQLGGLVTIEEIAKAVDEGKTAACYGYVKGWR